MANKLIMSPMNRINVLASKWSQLNFRSRREKKTPLSLSQYICLKSMEGFIFLPCLILGWTACFRSNKQKINYWWKWWLFQFTASEWKMLVITNWSAKEREDTHSPTWLFFPWIWLISCIGRSFLALSYPYKVSRNCLFFPCLTYPWIITNLLKC